MIALVRIAAGALLAASLGGCASTGAGTTTTTSIATIAQQIQKIAISACGWQPAIADVENVITSLYRVGSRTGGGEFRLQCAAGYASSDYGSRTFWRI
jgi:hypothetical protein